MTTDTPIVRPAATTETTNSRVATVEAAHAKPTPHAVNHATEHAVPRRLATSGGETGNVPARGVQDGSAPGALYLRAAATARAPGVRRISIAMSLAVGALRAVVQGSHATIVGTVSVTASAMTVVLLRVRGMIVGIAVDVGIERGTMIAGMEGEIGIGIGAVGDWRVIATNLVVLLLLVLMPRTRSETAIVSLERGVAKGVGREIGIGDVMIETGVDGGVARGVVVGIDGVDAVVGFPS
jgi:hypothetical protein